MTAGQPLEALSLESLSLSLAILQPSPFCNIACKYCYLPETSSTRRMGLDTLQHAIRFLMRKPGLLDKGSQMVFHCGEPLAVPIDFYRTAFRLTDEANTGSRPIPICFSTNATLISDEWCRLIAQRGHVRMRVSIDGPRWLHDGQRVDRGGRGTFDRVTAGIQRLRDHGQPFDVLCVVTERSLPAAEEMWYFFREIGARSVGFCIEEVLGQHDASSLQFGDATEKIKRFFETWLDLREREDPGYYLRDPDDILRLIERPRHKPFVRTDNRPLSLITIAADGGITLFSPELQGVQHPRYGDFVFGNVATDSMESLVASEKFRTVFGDIAAGVQQCQRECKYYRACGGGFPVSKLIENGTFRSTETLTCRLRIKSVADVVLEQLQRRRTRTIDQVVAASLAGVRLSASGAPAPDAGGGASAARDH